MILQATTLHAAAMAEIHAAAFPAGEGWGTDAIALQLAQTGAFGLIDPAGGVLLARVTAGEAEILTLAVAPAVRRQGRALALLNAAVARAHGAGARTLFLEVGAGNEAAKALYAGAGFVEIGRRLRYYANGSDALVLRLGLSAAATTPG
jgi:ribosomal-protein-alanine N-acetyltransferase